MARYIVSADSDGTITNIVDWDGLPTWAPPVGETATRSDKPAATGDHYDKATDTVTARPPEPPPPEPVEEATKPTNVTAAMSPYIVADADSVLMVDTSAGPVSIVLPAAASDGRELSVKKVSTDRNVMTLEGNGGTVDSSARVTSDAINRPSLTLKHQEAARDWRVIESFTGGLPQSAIISWGAENIGTAADTRVIPPGYVTGVLNTNTSRGFMAPRAGTIRNFTARHNASAGNGQAVVYGLRKNGEPITLLPVSLPAQNPGQAMNSGVLQVNAGDVIECVRTIAVTIGNGGVEAVCAAEFQGAPLGGGISSF